MAIVDLLPRRKSEVEKLRLKLAAKDKEIAAAAEARATKALDASLEDDDAALGVLVAEGIALRGERDLLAGALVVAERRAAEAADEQAADEQRRAEEQAEKDRKAQWRAAVQHCADARKATIALEATIALPTRHFQSLVRSLDAYEKLLPSAWSWSERWPVELRQIRDIVKHVENQMARAAGRGPSLSGTTYDPNILAPTAMLADALQNAGSFAKRTIVEQEMPYEAPPVETWLWPRQGWLPAPTTPAGWERWNAACADYAKYEVQVVGYSSYAPDVDGNWRKVADDPTMIERGARHLQGGLPPRPGSELLDAYLAMQREQGPQHVDPRNVPLLQEQERLAQERDGAAAQGRAQDAAEDIARLALERGNDPEPHIAAEPETPSVAPPDATLWPHNPGEGFKYFSSQSARDEMAAKNREMLSPEQRVEMASRSRAGLVPTVEQRQAEARAELLAAAEPVPADATTPAFTPVAGGEGSGSPAAPAGNSDNLEGLQ